MNDIGLYIIITNPVLPYSKIAEICVENNIGMMQLREKILPDKALLKIAKELKTITRGTNTKLVINDRPDIAALCDADCLHLGQDDISYEDARKIVGSSMMIGLSTHSIEQAKDALAKKPDYIGFGPVFATTTKANPDPEVGTEKLKQVLGFADVPVIALGGLFPENINEVLATGARNIALVRYFMQTENTKNRIIEIKSLLNKYEIKY
ncbi:MAG: thiamine phosphate synthase [Bacteroidetes bacterium]|nr:thiamine phosphate synthase [Bacteroidota bacterium]